MYRKFLMPALVLGFCSAAIALPVQIEVATTTADNTSTNGGQFTSVAFNQMFDETPVVFVLSTNEGADPSALRVRNVTTGGFELAPLEPPGSSATNGAIDGLHAAMTNVSYLAITPGSGFLGDLKFEAKLLDPSNTAVSSANQNNFDNVTFDMAFDAPPAVLVDIQTDNNPVETPLNAASSSPWITAVIDSGTGPSLTGITGTGFDVSLERAETGSGNVPEAEQIAYFAIERGEASFADDNGNIIDLAALISANNITGWSNNGGANNGTAIANGIDTPFGTTFANSPLVLASLATRDGGDGGWLRRGNIDNDSIFLTFDEDKANDNERSHTTEAASVVAFSQAFNLTIVPEPATGVLALLGVSFLARRRRCQRA